jgi:hypothetical protein
MPKSRKRMHGNRRRKSCLKSAFKQTQTIENVSNVNKLAKFAKHTLSTTNPYIKGLASKSLGLASTMLSPVETGSKDDPQAIYAEQAKKYENDKTWDGISKWVQTNPDTLGEKKFREKTEEEISKERLSTTMSNVEKFK